MSGQRWSRLQCTAAVQRAAERCAGGCGPAPGGQGRQPAATSDQAPRGSRPGSHDRMRTLYATPRVLAEMCASRRTTITCSCNYANVKRVSVCVGVCCFVFAFIFPFALPLAVCAAPPPVYAVRYDHVTCHTSGRVAYTRLTSRTSHSRHLLAPVTRTHYTSITIHHPPSSIGTPCTLAPRRACAATRDGTLSDQRPPVRPCSQLAGGTRCGLRPPGRCRRAVDRRPRGGSSRSPLPATPAPRGLPWGLQECPGGWPRHRERGP